MIPAFIPTFPTHSYCFQCSSPPFKLTCSFSSTTANMSLEDKLLQLQQLSETQQKHMQEANDFAIRQAEQLQESQRQLQQSQQTVSRLTEAFQALSQQPPPLTLSTAPKKKPELPQFDSKNILIWIRRIEAAYSRVGVTEAQDKFAWLESMFQVKLNPRIDSFLYGSNTDQDWLDFINYLKDEYGPTKRQKAQKLMAEVPRHDMKPSQYLAQLVDDTKDVTVDEIRKEHLLNTIPPRIREIMGKKVEGMDAAAVAKKADEFFDRQGKPLERNVNPVNQVSNTSSYASPPPSPAFTAAFSDEQTDVNFIKRGHKGNNRGRSSSSRPPSSSSSRPSNSSSSRSSFNKTPNASSGRPQGDAHPQHPPGTCKWHRRFGDKSTKCASDCPLLKSFTHQQKTQQGNGSGSRRQ